MVIKSFQFLAIYVYHSFDTFLFTIYLDKSNTTRRPELVDPCDKYKGKPWSGKEAVRSLCNLVSDQEWLAT